MTSPSGDEVTVTCSEIESTGYMTIWSALGDAYGNAQTTGLQSDGRFLEAYLMYVGSLNQTMELSLTGLEYFDPPINRQPEMFVTYWDGERWSYDNNLGYDIGREFTPNDECFIIARLYADTIDGIRGIVGIDQYIDNESDFPTGGLGNLHLFLQSGNNFRGRVLIDDIECYESYEFTPEVDVRKKISVGEYGIADLTKYYLSLIHI